MDNSNSDNIQFLLLELQHEIVSTSVTVAPDRLLKAAAFCAELADLADLPITASLVPISSDQPTLIEPLHNLAPLVRTTVSVFSDAAIAERLRSAGRNGLAIGGVSSVIAVLRNALDARRAGYDVFVLHDLCGGFDPRTEQAAFAQMASVGVIPTSLTSLAAGLIDDMTSDLGGAVMGAISRFQGWR